ncbi:MAG: SIS domain-containing protein, partial [Actinomycetota bacterium]|nr:SIS domain-containing protein [Actinomycetota bacterium]
MSYEDSNTYKEINSQILSWHHIYKDITEKNQVELKIFKKKYDKIIICGCGSSYNLSQSAAFFTQSILKDCNIVAVPSSEILLNPDLFINKKKRSLLIGFSRSGETTETLEVFKKFSCNDNIVSFTFSGQNFSSLTKLSDSYYVCKKAKEKSIVMTVSFSSMLFAYCLIIAATYCEKILNDFEKLLGYLDKKLSYLNTAIEEFIYSNNFNNYFVLGSGFNYGIAVEVDLKMK